MEIINKAFYYDDICVQKLMKLLNENYNKFSRVNYYDFLFLMTSLQYSFLDLELMEHLLAIYTLKKIEYKNKYNRTGGLKKEEYEGQSLDENQYDAREFQKEEENVS